MEQLETLKQIFQNGYITEAEYERRKTQIIDKLTNTSLDALGSGLVSSSDVLMDGIGSKSEVAFESAAQNSLNNSNTLDNYAIQSTDCNMQIEDCSSFKGADIYSSAPSAAASSGKAERCEDDTNLNSTTYDNDATFVDSFQQKASSSSLQERKQLAKSISRLDAASLQKLLQIIMNEAPHLVKNPNGKKDFSFDLNEFDDSMLLRTFEVVEELNCVNLQENEIPSKKRISEYETDSYNTLNNVTSNNSKILTNSGSFITPFKSRKIEDTPAAFSPVSDFKSESGEPSDIISLSKSQEDLFTSILSTPSVDLATDLSLYASPAIPTQQDFSSYFNQLQSSPSVVDSNVYSLELLDNSTSDVSMLNSISKEQEDDIIGIPVDTITNENDLIEDISDDRFTGDSLVLTPNDSNTSSSPCTEVKGESKKIRIKIQVYRVEKNGTGNKPWCCDAPGCNKKFSDSSNLIKHLRVHTQEKPYDCPYCGKCFSHNSSLKEHMNIHTGAKPFICEICQQPFAQSANLKRHMRIHTGEKPFTCSECGKGFSQSTNLKSHEERVHKQKNSTVTQKAPNSLMPPSLNNT